MFQPGDKVICINDDMGPTKCVPGKNDLKTMKCVSIRVDGVYTVKEYLSLEEYEKRNPGSDWWLKGEVKEEWQCGVVHLEEALGADGSDLTWLACRFKPAGNQ